jgi:type II secretory pathway component GspD/PulD (secretin)
VQDDIKKSNNKVPLLGDIPGLGALFRSDSHSRAQANLMIFITPTIIQDSDYQPTATTFMKNTFPKDDTMEPDWSSWNSGKPKDWSQPSAKTAEGNYSEVDLSNH